jgi:hypothetical protein
MTSIVFRDHNASVPTTKQTNNVPNLESFYGWCDECPAVIRQSHVDSDCTHSEQPCDEQFADTRTTAVYRIRAPSLISKQICLIWRISYQFVSQLQPSVVQQLVSIRHLTFNCGEIIRVVHWPTNCCQCADLQTSVVICRDAQVLTGSLWLGTEPNRRPLRETSDASAP